MAGLAGFLSAAAPLISLKFVAAEGVVKAAQASTSPALQLAQVAASVPKPAANLLSSTPLSNTQRPAAPAVALATLASQNPSIANAGIPSVAGQLQPPQVIVETNYIVYTQVRTAAPSYITVTQTIRPSPPPPPPPPPPSPPPPPPPPPPPKQIQPLSPPKQIHPSPIPKQAQPPSPPKQVQPPSSPNQVQPPSPPKQAEPPRLPSLPPPAAKSQAPNAVPLVIPAPLVVPAPLILPSTPTPKMTPQLAATSPSPPPPPPPLAAAPLATTLLSTPNLPLPPLVLNPIMSAQGPERGGMPNLSPNPQAQTGPPGGPPMGPPDPANGAFPGGIPNKNIDLPVTIMFMVLFMLGAYVHLSIYRRNAKRGHKFLISDIVFDFCMIRTVTCIFRITWSIVSTRGVVLLALITENGGAALMFAVNIFFAQRLVRSIHPKAGWCTAFSQFSLILLFSVPAFIILNMTSTIIAFFSVGNVDRLETTDDLLKFGSSWNTFLSIFPVLVVSGCLSVPGPKPEKFGSGSQRVKVALLYLGSFLLITGQSIRLFAVFNKELPGATPSVIYGKAVFYTTGFFFELIVVALYAIMRVDLRFHIPNGASGPGDYSGDRDKGSYSVEEIERLIDDLEVPHQIMRERKGPEDMEMVFTIFFATKDAGKDKEKKDTGEESDETSSGTNAEDAALPERPKRITRRQTLIDAINRPPRPPRTPSVYPDIPDMYAQIGEPEMPPRRPTRPSMYSQFDNGQAYDAGADAQYRQQYWGASPPYGNEKEGMKSVDLRR
ncbi:uncharacterized protein CLUP02_02353 [Colletotrichum lupini]|uniref:Uncharacterized protein n=1 Tax=Colletotrichum lupini TaxID=145971 RepID=A0A9Q8WAJ7_9PEZI|nr:uncharacterized protein CLUP02_02353 [Colletotrichum lupini]UQC75697.1 hypothetical protein CLUP02_02353 [Colletotrichum lupini]